MITIVSLLTRALVVSAALLVLPAVAPAQEVTVRVGNAPSIASGALLIAIERGYFREAGIKVVIDPLDSAANAIALLAQNQDRLSRAASRPATSTRWSGTCRSPSRCRGSQRRSATI